MGMYKIEILRGSEVFSFIFLIITFFVYTIDTKGGS